MILHCTSQISWSRLELSLRRWFILAVSHNNESINTYTASNPGPSFSKSQQHLKNLLLQKRPCPLRGLLSTTLVGLLCLSFSQSFKLSWLLAFFQHQIRLRLAAISSSQTQTAFFSHIDFLWIQLYAQLPNVKLLCLIWWPFAHI